MKFTCSHCGKEFDDAKSWDNHRLKFHYCATCQFAFRRHAITLECSLKNNGIKCRYKRKDDDDD